MSLRSPDINYDKGWFFITFQVAHNKSVFGAIVGEACVLNALGEAVKAAWITQSEHTPELKYDAFVVMPNHFHAICRVGTVAHDNIVGPLPPRGDLVSPNIVGPLPPRRDLVSPNIVGPLPPRRGKGGELSRIIGRFKSYTTHLYHKMREAGTCVDIGPRLWQDSFYDNLISTHEELERIRRYIRENPARWNEDRFGAVTTHSVGNAELLNGRLVAFVASEAPARWQGDYDNPSARCQGDYDNPSARCQGGYDNPSARCQGGYDNPSARWPRGHDNSAQSQSDYEKVFSCRGAVISTFTSPEERMVKRMCLQKRHPFIWICPGGIPEPLPSVITTACKEGRAFVCSPVPSKTGVNKQRAIWCNQYVLQQAKTIWRGTIRPGGSLETLLSTYQSKRIERI